MPQRVIMLSLDIKLKNRQPAVEIAYALHRLGLNLIPTGDDPRESWDLLVDHCDSLYDYLAFKSTCHHSVQRKER